MNEADQARLSEIEARTAAATEGEWEYNYEYEEVVHDLKKLPNGVTQASWITSMDTGDDDIAENKGDNGSFIAASRSDVPWLVSLVQEQDAQAVIDDELIERLQKNSHVIEVERDQLKEQLAEALEKVSFVDEASQETMTQFHEMAAELNRYRDIVQDLAKDGATYCNYSDMENDTCAICGNVVDGSLYFSPQAELGHAKTCVVLRARKALKGQS